MLKEDFVEIILEFMGDLNKAQKEEDTLRQELGEPYFYQAWDSDWALDWAYKKSKELGLMTEAQAKRKEQFEALNPLVDRK